MVLQYARTALFLITTMLVSAALASAPSAGDDIVRHLENKQFEHAAEAVDRLLAKQPKDPQARFLKGLVLSGQKKTTEAIEVFRALTEDSPGLAEPHNNLAVLYASQREYDKAIATLEVAIRINPAYAAARENLGDIYLQLASASYEKALRATGAGGATQHKLQSVRQLLISPLTDTGNGSSVATSADSVSSRSTSALLVPVAKSTITREVEQVVKEWRAAWSNKDVKRYLSFYAEEFRPAGGDNRKAWEASRIARLSRPEPIELSVEDVQVVVGDKDAFVTFQQKYRSGITRSNDKKTLEMVQRDGRWLITRERTTKLN